MKKVWLITGAGSGIGGAPAVSFRAGAVTKKPASTEVSAGEDLPEWARRDSNARPLAPERRPPRQPPQWTGVELRATLQRTLPATLGVPASDVREVNDVRVAYRTGSGRVGWLTIGLRGSAVRVDGPNVRQVLRPPSGDLLRSNDFSLTVTRVGRRVTRLVADGAGAGHRVGFCQWGAVGRSRAGQDYERILTAYYPGDALERLY